MYNLIITWCFLPFGGERQCRNALIDQIEFFPNEHILEMCCGTGRATVTLWNHLKAGSRLTGIDLSSGQLREAVKNIALQQVQLIECDASCTGFRDESFDKVFITHAIHEMPRSLRNDVFVEAKRPLKNGGKMII